MKTFPFASPTLAAALLAATTVAQGFPANGSTSTFPFTGSAVDVTIPTANTPGSIRVVVKGGDGGGARSGNNRQCTALGGQGARIEAYLGVGGGLAPGGTLRVIVGGKGGDGSDRESAGGGGGGGTGLLYAAPGSSLFSPVVVAGGGGGAFSRAAGIGFNSCAGRAEGQRAAHGDCGTSTPDVGNYAGGIGGCNGLGGSGGERGTVSTARQPVPAGAGGGGFLSPGIAPGIGGGAGSPAGAAGSGSGGWGCGGGGTGANQSYQYGAGGGGGGYSGGGGGSRANVGGGAGSFVDASRLLTSASYGYDSQRSSDGYLVVEAIAARPGDTCQTPFDITDAGTMSFVRRLRGNTYDNSVSVPANVDANCSYFSGANARDEFYRFVNNTRSARRIRCWADPLKENIWSDGWENGCNGPNRCVLLGYRNARIDYTVPAGGTIVFRVSGFHTLNPNGIAFDNTLEITAISGPDADSDGVYDDFDNCPNTHNPNQSDIDGDGVGDVCDVAIGDNSIDTDGDGKPDAIDPCPGPAVDCDRNGLDDSCDAAGVVGRLSTFDPSTANPRTLFLNAYIPQAQTGMQVEGNALTLLDLDPTVPDRTGTTALFEPVSPDPVSSFSAEFWVKHDSSQSTPGGGYGFALLAKPWGWDRTSVPLREITQPGALKVHFFSADAFGNPANNVSVANHVSDLFVSNPLPFPVTSSTWRKIGVDFDGTALTVTVQDLGGQPVEVISALPIPNFRVAESYYAISADSLPGNSRVTTLIDQVRFTDTSGTFHRDLDGNQILDACEFGGQASRAGNPANPEALQFGSGIGTMMGVSYRPTISSANGFFPEGDQDFLLVGFAPANVPTPFGTQLCGPPVAFTGFRDVPFNIFIPQMGSILGLPIVFQGISFDIDNPSGFDAQFTNAIDTTVTGWQPGG